MESKTRNRSDNTDKSSNLLAKDVDFQFVLCNGKDTFSWRTLKYDMHYSVSRYAMKLSLCWLMQASSD